MLALVAVAGCGRHTTRSTDSDNPGPEDVRSAEAPATRRDETAPTLTEMEDVDLHVADGVVIHVRRLEGEAVSSRKGEPVGLDDPGSYEIRLRSAETFVEYPDLSRVLNDFTFNFEGAPVKGLEVRREEDPGERDEIQLTGRLKKVLGVPFEIEGRPEATADGRLRIRTLSIQAFDVKVAGLMDVLGMKTEDLLGGLEERGIAVDGEDLVLDVGRAFPPPRVSGRVRSVHVTPTGLALSFGAAPPAARSGVRSNYLWFRGGTIRIGRMTQRDADLRIVDDDPNDPFDFDVRHMNDQLAAGYAKLAPSGGLTMHVPDEADVR
ncbi:MAG TPA: hypothetical protein VIC56_04300 [Gemmatimonadota bacterium]